MRWPRIRTRRPGEVESKGRDGRKRGLWDSVFSKEPETIASSAERGDVQVGSWGVPSLPLEQLKGYHRECCILER